MTGYRTGPWAALLSGALLIASTATSATGWQGPSQFPTAYSDNAVAVVPDKFGPTSCRKYTVGGNQVRKRFPNPAGGTLYGTGGAQASYSMSGNKESLTFSDATPPVQIAIVSARKGLKKINAVYYYLNEGVEEDGNLQVLNPNNANDALRIVDFALCSDITDTAGEGPTVGGGRTFDEVVPRCGSPGTPSSPQGCPAGPGFDTSREIVLIDFKPLLETVDGEQVPVLFDDTNGALDPRTCFCTGGHETVANLEALFQCDDSQPAADGNNPQNFVTPTAPGGTCTVTPAPGTKVELIGEQSNDPYFCRTVNGTRRCWRY